MNTKQPRLMEFMTTNELREAMKQTKTVIVPLGVTEQHGYHLPLNTDVYNAVELAELASEETGCIVAPPLYYSFSGGTLPGTINIRPSVVSLMVNDICHSLAMQGFENIVLLLGHAGTENMQAILEATDMFLRNNPHLDKVKLALVPFTDLSETIQKAFEEKDFHAGYIETSLMMYWHPELVRDEIVLDRDEVVEMLRQHQDNYVVREKPLEHPFIVPRIKQHPAIEVGVMGYPERASAELGEKICNECVRGLVDLIKQMEETE